MAYVICIHTQLSDVTYATHSHVLPSIDHVLLCAVCVYVCVYVCVCVCVRMFT